MVLLEVKHFFFYFVIYREFSVLEVKLFLPLEYSVAGGKKNFCDIPLDSMLLEVKIKCVI